MIRRLRLGWRLPGNVQVSGRLTGIRIPYQYPKSSAVHPQCHVPHSDTLSDLSCSDDDFDLPNTPALCVPTPANWESIPDLEPSWHPPVTPAQSALPREPQCFANDSREDAPASTSLDAVNVDLGKRWARCDSSSFPLLLQSLISFHSRGARSELGKQKKWIKGLRLEMHKMCNAAMKNARQWIWLIH